MNAISGRPTEAERKAKYRAKKRANEEAGLFEFPSGTWIKHETMEALYDIGEYLGLDDAAEILNAVLLTLAENPRFMVIIEKALIARVPRDTKPTGNVGKYHVGSILDRMIKE